MPDGSGRPGAGELEKDTLAALWAAGTPLSPAEVHAALGATLAYNYPALLVLHKLAPALAAGNAVVLKPARTTPLSALALVSTKSL